jgi:hypothetical protein
MCVLGKYSTVSSVERCYDCVAGHYSRSEPPFDGCTVCLRGSITNTGSW